ncbi:MAG: hypothetical protein ABI795_01690 [Chthoniobacterales bacterium]
MKLSASKRLLVFIALVLAIPALVSRLVPAKRNFDARPLHRLRARQPQIVLIGDSMLDSRIDGRLLEERLGVKPIEILWNGGAASACWYLMLKNYVLPSGASSRHVYIVFRDRMLTDATFRTAGIYRPFLESLMHDDEPVCRLVLGNNAQSETSGWEKWMTALYPVNARRNMQHQRISDMMLRAITANGHTAKALELRVNNTFEVVKMRGDLMAESGDLSDRSVALFDPNPQRNFLPHLIDLAAEAKVPLSFVRVKRHANAAGQVVQSDALRAYIGALSRWLSSKGCELIDFTDDPRYTPDMYLKAKDDHIGPWAKARSTEIFASRLQTESQIKP